MDGVHDLGGLTSFGPVVRHDPEPEPAFAEPWEGRVFALSGPVLVAAKLGTARFRHAIERMDGVHYLTSSYYEHWLTALATLAVERGLVDADELQRRSGGFPLSRPVASDPVPAALAGPAAPAPRFTVGQHVRVRNVHPTGHTRCPGYVRGCRGLVVRVDAPSPVPELEVHHDERVPEPTLAVRFSAAELWGDATEPETSVTVDLYERYLDDAEAGAPTTAEVP
jgi:nitrile hydratase beta subunit